jgi:phosphoglycerate dehydrogenase-like enzyme
MTRRHRLVVDLVATSRNWALPKAGARRIHEAAPPDWEVVVSDTPTLSHGDGGHPASPEVLEAIPDAEVYFGFGLAPELFAAAAQLRWVHSASAGVGSLLFPAMLASNVMVTNSGGIMGHPIADHVVAGILYFVRNLDIALDQQRRGEWNKTPFVEGGALVRELSECRVLIIGTGGIGNAVASRLAPFGCHCTGIRRRTALGVPAGFARVTSLDALEEELPAADIVVLATPLTPATRGLLSAQRMDCLPPNAIVVNVARGALLDEAALADRLGTGRLRGAVLDVFAVEPLPSSSPLWSMRNALITPHVSAVSPRLFWKRELDLFLDNWVRYREGHPLRNYVDKEAGY